MGGLGSGRPKGRGWNTTDDLLQLDIRKWKREGFLKPGCSGGWTWSRRGEPIANINYRVEEGAVRLIYRVREYGGDWVDKDYRVVLDRTSCHYGGERVWFRCPCCYSRVAILYSSGQFACRRCHRLAYACQRETDADRAARRADKIRERLGWPEGILNGSGWRKPKWMRWRTYYRLVRQEQRLVMVSLDRMDQRLAMLGESLHSLTRSIKR